MGARGFVKFAGSVAVVTGGSSGIGKGIAEALISQGSNVIICARDGAKVAKVAGEIGAFPEQVDVADQESVERLAKRVLDRFGKINILCNNAGVGPAAQVRDLSISDWRWMLGVNLWGVIHGITSILPHILSNPDGGHVVNTASLAALWPVPGLGAYSVAKSGVVALTETLHLELNELSDRVGATAFCPGPVRTDIGSSLRGRRQQGASALVDMRLEDRFPPDMFLEPRHCGDLVVDAIKHNRLYLVTHPSLAAKATGRWHALMAAFKRAQTLEK
ncbi:SDR family NAD(P)-dependent oxidoreductase [Bradyrhizobium diazoefficiens]|uniref:SDR family NAD(P)-dependent oxidoreductase n=1 Tax=Bradyrhizobium diazoefficiens TaxID=1355477 RepID=UPI001B8D2B9D|nr:SDR family NAD(P)-dependent oxidoreductase [Bradyrhizobium diazoefficiens]MBR0863500.1 SDR family NAD(P)-dependent oxidoreductase [Bradyrhizobium diazoefficiens]MBR0888185.1 SDR family NAD(P)-dependent oxidoreductase [Bradyrhizobium diazoefficiens]MBR0919826.1 SDR family NAD(P)-dependent oxidoreductase [Bradyrhizobium diazoefficiens]